MEHIAIDLGGRESQICVRSSDGKVVDETRYPTAKLRDYLSRRAPGRVILETCAEGFGVAGWALSAGHEVRVVPATLVRSLGVGARRIKTDRRDAQVLSEVSARIDLPSVHVPSQTSRDIKTLCGTRETLVGARTKLINNVRGWLRTYARRLRTGGTRSFPKRVREHCQKPDAPTILPCVERQLIVIDALSEQIHAADLELKTYVKGNELCCRLMTVPGVGPVTSARFVAAIDEIGRFSSAHAVESYIGLVPGESSSSDRTHRLSITKAAPQLRWALVQAAWTARRKPMDPMVLWSQGVERRRGKKIAVVALARKLAGVLYALWRDGTSYNPLHESNRILQKHKGNVTP